MRENIINKAKEIYSEGYYKALKFTLNAEGAYCWITGDRGGQTYCGVARAYNSSWKGWQVIDKEIAKFPELMSAYSKTPKSITEFNKILDQNDELQMSVLEFYYINYYKKSGAALVEKLSTDISAILFDIAVISGVKRASKTIQKMLNRNYKQTLVVDGDFGVGTLTAVSNAITNYSEKAVVESLFIEYVDNVTESSKLGDNVKFLQGWLNRTNNLRNYCRLN